MKKYRVLWWEEHIVRKEVDVEAIDEEEAQDKAMDGDVGDNKITVEFTESTDSGHIRTTLIKEK